MAASNRVTLTKNEAASAYGQRLVHQILAISGDGALVIDEVRALHNVLREGPPGMNAVSFLRAKTTAILVDGQLDQLETYELRRAMERVVPKDVRENLTILLSNIGLPTIDQSENAWEYSWRDDPITARQYEYINVLGGVASERMTKGQASVLIDHLLETRPPTPRQQMVIRFFDRLDLMTNTKEQVSVWLDELFGQREDYQRAWDLFKVDVGDDGTIRDPTTVPIGAYRNYLRVRGGDSSIPRSEQRRRWRYWILGGVCCIAVGLWWLWR